jgi:hypothetical protein
MKLGEKKKLNKIEKKPTLALLIKNLYDAEVLKKNQMQRRKGLKDKDEKMNVRFKLN